MGGLRREVLVRTNHIVNQASVCARHGGDPALMPMGLGGADAWDRWAFDLGLREGRHLLEAEREIVRVDRANQLAGLLRHDPAVTFIEAMTKAEARRRYGFQG